MDSSSAAPVTSIMDDVVLSPRARAGASEDDYRRLFEAAYPRLVRTVWFVVHDQAVAEDVAQDAFVELYRHWPKVRTYDRPEAWVRRVAVRKAQREAARAARRPGLERTAALVDVSAGAPDATLPDPALRAALTALTPRQRTVVVLYYLEDLPMREVADLVGCSEATGFVHLHAARKRLAELLSEEVDSDVR
jgi:RNA polymerase sigma-70 factor, ECF subfamily